MKIKRIIIITSILAILIGISGALIYKKTRPTEIIITGMVGEISEQQLILNSDIIVDGKVKEIKESKWSNPGMKIEGKRNVLQTDIVVTISELLSGKYNNRDVVVRIDKGYDKKERVKYISDGYPDFEVGEHVLLFLSRDDGDLVTDEDYFVLTGMFQGKWNVEDNGVIANKREYVKHLTPKRNKDVLKTQIKTEKDNNPDWKEKREAEKEIIRKRNIELFGE